MSGTESQEEEEEEEELFSINSCCIDLLMI